MKILVSDPLPSEGIEMLKEKAEVTEYNCKDPLELESIIGDYDALIVRSGTQVTPEVIEAGKKLKVIGRAGVGVDNIDVDKATEKGIVVINTPEGNTISAAEHTIALITSLARNIPNAHHSTRSGSWERSKFLGVELYKKSLGILGLGRIGREVARRARAMGMYVLAYDPYVSPEQGKKMGLEIVGLNNLLQEADFLTLHLPDIPSTHHLIDEVKIEIMKPGVYIVNCARGGLIKEEALCKGLQEGKIAGAAIDVFETEPPENCPLLEMDNVIVTPHLGASTAEAQNNVAIQAAEQVLTALEGGSVCYAVNVPAEMPESTSEIKPYQPLMELLGSFYMQFFGGPIDEVEIKYSGEIAEKKLSPLTTSCLTGMLQVFMGDQVNHVNAPLLAQNRGIKFKEVYTSSIDNFTNLVTLTVKSGGGVNTLSGTVFSQDDIRIVQINDYEIEVLPSSHILLCTYKDQPGVIARLTTSLGEEEINIAGMQVGRKNAGGEALMVLQIDDPLSKRVQDRIKSIDQINCVYYVEPWLKKNILHNRKEEPVGK